MTGPQPDENGKPAFEPATASALIGKYVLVGITYLTASGDFDRQEQFHGRVISADERKGISIALEGARSGETKWLPPVTNTFKAAPKGDYRLLSTGEVVVDPDFTTQWTVNKPPAA